MLSDMLVKIQSARFKIRISYEKPFLARVLALATWFIILKQIPFHVPACTLFVFVGFYNNKFGFDTVFFAHLQNENVASKPVVAFYCLYRKNCYDCYGKQNVNYTANDYNPF